MSSKLLILALCLTAALGWLPPASAEDGDPMIEVGATFGGGAANVEGIPATHSGNVLFGTISLTQQGQLKIIWNGLSGNLGSVSVSFIQDQAYWSSVFPSVTIDLKELYGKSWKTEMNLKIAGGLWDDSPTRGTAELTLGQISLNLSQSLLKRDALSWDIGESAGIGGYYSVFHYVTGQTDPSFPANVTLNSKIVAQLSPKVLLTATLGAYAMLVHKFNSPDDLHAGVTASLAAEFAGRVTMGIQLQGEEQITFSSNPAYVKTAQLTAFLKFLLSKHAGVAQSLVVSVTASYDEENPAASGLPNESVLAGLQYVVAF